MITIYYHPLEDYKECTRTITNVAFIEFDYIFDRAKITFQTGQTREIPLHQISTIDYK